MQTKSIDNLTLALAGIFQSAALVHDLAQHGHAEATSCEASIQSLFKLSADSTEAIFGGAQGVRYGLSQLRKFVDPSAGKIDSRVLQYVTQLIQLERKLHKSSEYKQELEERIQFAVKQAEFFPVLESNMLSILASIYSDTISYLHPRIQVFGKEPYLMSDDIANKIRVCLLAGIRSAVLWHQLGGRPWTFIFKRKQIKRAIDQWSKTS